jgi:hypothetical protein
MYTHYAFLIGVNGLWWLLLNCWMKYNTLLFVLVNWEGFAALTAGLLLVIGDKKKSFDVIMGALYFEAIRVTVGCLMGWTCLFAGVAKSEQINTLCLLKDGSKWELVGFLFGSTWLMASLSIYFIYKSNQTFSKNKC